LRSPRPDLARLADAHELGVPAQARIRYRYRTLRNCGGRLKIIAAIVDPQVVIQILTHLGLPARAPPRSPAQSLSLFKWPDSNT
jgi:hypothetical protein